MSGWSWTRFAETLLALLVAPLLKAVGKAGLKAWGVSAVIAVVWWRNASDWDRLKLLLVLLAVLAVGGAARQRRPSVRERRLSWRGQQQEDRPEREPIPPALRAFIIRRDDGVCGICGFRVADPSRIHIDHINPVHNGGTNDPENLQTAHDSCNLIKGGEIGWQPPYRPERTT